MAPVMPALRLGMGDPEDEFVAIIQGWCACERPEENP